MARIHIAAVAVLSFTSVCATAQDCALPDSGTWTLDMDHFVASLSDGDAAKAAKIREAFSAANSHWIFENGTAVFSINGYDQMSEVQVLDGCRVRMTTLNTTSTNTEEFAFSSTGNRLCFTFSHPDGRPREECHIRE